MSYLELDSAKFMTPVLQRERRQLRRARNVRALRAFVMFLIGLGAAYGGVLAGQTIHLARPFFDGILTAARGLFQVPL